MMRKRRKLTAAARGDDEALLEKLWSTYQIHKESKKEKEVTVTRTSSSPVKIHSFDISIVFFLAKTYGESIYHELL